MLYVTYRVAFFYENINDRYVDTSVRIDNVTNPERPWRIYFNYTVALFTINLIINFTFLIE